MRILIISYFFPPFNGIGALRVGKSAKYLMKFGHDVRVVTAGEQPLDASLPVEIPKENIVYTRWFNVNWVAQAAAGGRDSATKRGNDPKGPLRNILMGMRAAYRALYKRVVSFPDDQIGWMPYARRAAEKIAREWKPDLILGSGWPMTSLIVAHRVSKKFNIPWVAELRDLWLDNHYYQWNGLRMRIESRVERRVLNSASGLVTVSSPLAKTLEDKFARPTEVVLNGYDASDFPPLPELQASNGPIRILYTGVISMYDDKRNPGPLFQALRLLNATPDQIRIVFYGRYLEIAREMARKHGVENLVEVNEQVSYTESLALQCKADILLLLLWNDPREKGVFTGKLFEYLYARRPILAVGPEDNVASQLILERGAGFVGIEPEIIAAQLRIWIEERREKGLIARLPDAVMLGLSREEQTRTLERFLCKVLDVKKGVSV